MSKIINNDDKNKTKLSKRQLEILNYIKKYVAEKGYSPSIRDICLGNNISSSATAHTHVKNLIEKGLLKKVNNKFRTIEIVGENEFYNKQNGLCTIKLVESNDINLENAKKITLPTYIFDITSESFILNDNKLYVIRKLRQYNHNDLIAILNNNKITITNYNENNNKIYGKVINIIEKLK